MISEAELTDGALELTGRITTASNATFLGSIGETSVVYKPVRGEKPLWDFPDGTLANRERAAYLISEALEWNIVPRTWLRDGPLGPGMVQLWQETDDEQDAVDLVPANNVPDTGWRSVFEGRDEEGALITLIHEDSPALRRMAVFDVIVNNADRKGNHILAMPDGHRYGVDHGITFHSEHKLRTVLWGFIDDDLEPDELSAIEQLLWQLEGETGEALADLITADERAALTARCHTLLIDPRFPAPAGEMPAVPWPLF